MNVRLWGTRGSLATPGPQTERYGGNTSCVELRGADGQLLVLDAGTGIRPLSAALGGKPRRVDILLSHLHMDHVQGLGFFSPLFDPEFEVHIWGPPSTTLDLRDRLSRYLSPPLFPVQMRDLPCKLSLHNAPLEDFEIGALRVRASLVCHPGPTVGYRVSEDGNTIAYLSDHEPALGCPSFPDRATWTSGYELAEGADLLVHDAQYTADEYEKHVGWGHSSIDHALAFADMAKVGRLVTFHHDPEHDDATIDRLVNEARRSRGGSFEVIGGAEGASFEIGQGSRLGDGVKRILAIVPDLLIESRIEGAAGGLKANVETASPQEATERIASMEPELVIIDLATPGLDVKAIASAARERRVRLAAFYPHVDVALRRAGEEAGIEHVYPRSRFLRELRAILREGLQK